MVSELLNYDRCQSAFSAYIYRRIFIGDAIQANQCPILAEIRNVSNWIVKNEVFEFHEFYTARM